MRRFLLLVALVAGLLALPAPPHAAACSCAPAPVAERLPEADGAFVGRLVSRGELPVAGRSFSSADPVPYRYEVERVVKGAVATPVVEVWSAWSGASCGLETPVGQRAGLLLRQDGGRWTSNLCAQVDPDELEAAAPPAGVAGNSLRPASATTPADPGTSGRPLLVAGAGAGLLAALALTFIRRRKLPALPQL